MSGGARSDWLATERADLATTRILDVAEELFVENGVAAVTMRGLADAVGCSRATLYRYYAGKAELLAAYVDRAATELGASVAAAVGDETFPADRLVAAVTTAVAGVRSNPALSAWFVPDTAAQSTSLALVSPAIEQITVVFLTEILPTADLDDLRERARWLVRVIVSLLTSPGASDHEERALLERFVVPVVVGDG
ncbi:TetR/AcrR family transcriptional regulator [Gordonia sp. PKS22-38]|uniref:TetR/AcrR family transcriptional regulator n=1 Tax=Gordonia prachuapensis TaxID=3115651 RepID=A0ABU7N1D8_9ACTN|nr:TetR/AcrR family transcriptional regulator [Gordonia sp. PKS22-38]